MYASQFHNLAPITERPLVKQGAGFYEGKLALMTRTHFWVWNDAGDLHKTLTAKDGQNFTSWISLPEGLLISYHNREGQMGTVLLDGKFEELSHFDFFASRFQNVDGTLYTFPISAESPHFPHKHPYLFVPIHLQPEGETYRLTTLKPALAKAHPQLIHSEFEYKSAWLVKLENGYAVMNELEPKVYLYSPLQVSIEKREGHNTPSNIVGSSIPFQNFNPITSGFQPPKGVFKQGEVLKMLWDYNESHSTINWFGKIDDGFLVAYSVPDCEDTNPCQESLLGLQKLNSNFEMVGAPRIQPGNLIGIRNGQVYILQFQRALTMPPPPGPYQPRLLILNLW